MTALEAIAHARRAAAPAAVLATGARGPGVPAPAPAVPTPTVPAAGTRGLFARTTSRVLGSAVPPPLAGPSVAVLCAAPRSQAAAASVALALAHLSGRPYALAAVVGACPPAPASFAPSARRAAARLRQRGKLAAAVGRTVWLASAAPPTPIAAVGPGERGRAGEPLADPAGAAAAASAALARAAQAIAAPAALAIPFARCAALDRVLAWHDAIVVVREPDATHEIAELVLASLALLDRPAVTMPAPSRLAERVASAGLRAPAPAIDAVARLGLARGTG